MDASDRPVDSLARMGQALAQGQITRRQFVQRALAAGLSASALGSLLAACGSGESTAGSSPAPMDTTLPAKLSVFNWADYMPGSIKKGFKQKYGVEIDETYFDSNEALVAKLSAGAGGYDIIVPSNDAVHIMMKMGILRALDMQYIPNFKHVMQRFQKPDYDPETDGRKYSVPYQWGTTGIGHRKDIITDSITKYADLWNEKYKGNITMLNDQRDVLGAGLAVLGYTLNTTVQSELDAAVAKLIEQKPLVSAYDSINTKRALVAGTPLVQGWNGYVLQAYDELGPDKLEYVLPAEMIEVWCDNMAVPKSAPNPYAAHLFIDYVLQPKIAADLVNYTWYSSPVPAAKQYSDPIVWSFVPTDEEMARSQFLQDVGEFRTSYDEAWRELKSA